MGFITTRDNQSLYYKDWGTGRPVILIHGWPLSSDSWDDQSLALAQAGYRVIAYDRRGFGRSSQPWSGYEYNTLADDLADVMEATGAQDATIIGFSMGGGEVARYLSRYAGKNVAQAGLISSIVPFMLKTADNPNGVDASVFAQMADGMKKDRAHFFKGFFHDFYGVSMLSKPVSEEQLQTSWVTAMEAGLKGTLDCATAFATTDFRGEIGAFSSIPTLIIHGTEDHTVPIDISGRAAAKLIPHASFLEYTGAPHGLFATHKEQFTSDLLSFLGQA